MLLVKVLSELASPSEKPEKMDKKQPLQRYATEWAGDKTQPCVLENKLYNSVTKNHIAYEVAMTLLSTHLWTGRCNRYWCLESERNRRPHMSPNKL